MIDLHDPAFLAGDRHPAYARLRAERPAWRLSPDGGPETWVVSRYADVQAIARMREGRVQPPGEDAPPWMSEGPALQRLRGNLAQTDAPVHDRLRAVLQPMFLPRHVEALRAVSAASVARALAGVADLDGPFDVVQRLAAQVPKGVICHLVGIPEQDWDRLAAEQHDFLLIFSPFALAPAQKQRLDEVVTFYSDYFDGLLRDTPPARRSALVQQLMAAEDAGTMTRAESLSIMHTVLDAGYETTRTSISNAVELLAGTPALFDEIRADPSVIPNAVEEILRVRSPIHLRHRYLVAPFTAADGSVIPAGAQVLMLLAAANRDEAVFEAPDRVDLRRANAARHQAFGGGLHHCLGSPIARIQLQETLRGLAGAYERLSLPQGPGPRHASLKFPSLQSLQVTAARAGAATT